jgi:transmembrane sensor
LKAYPEDNNEQLTVEEGKVQFSMKSNPEKQLILTRNEQGILNVDGKLNQTHVYAAAYSGWKSAKLMFNDLSLAEISILLSREYNIKVAAKNKSLRKKRFTGSYQNSSLHAIVRDISQALHCQYQLNNQSLIFY